MPFDADVAADYFVESMAADVAARANDAYGGGVALADAQANVPVLLKEVAAAAGWARSARMRCSSPAGSASTAS